MPTSNHVFSAFSFIAFVLVSTPLPWHLEAWNTGTCMYMIWVGLGNLVLFINSIIWDNNALNSAHHWSDISSYFLGLLSTGIPASSLCINRRLYYIATRSTVTISQRQRRQSIAIDLAIALGLPLVGGVMNYLCKSFRYAIFEEVGPAMVINTTLMSIFLVFTWPLAISLVSAVYCGLTIHAFFKRRVQFKQLLSSNNNLNTSRYVRLMCLAGTELVCGVPISGWILEGVIKNYHRVPWKGFRALHSKDSQVLQIPSVLWRSSFEETLRAEFQRWILVMCAFIFFAFFGFADEARKNYRIAFSSVAKRFGYSTATTSSTGRSGISFAAGIPSLPIFVRKDTSRAMDQSFSSFEKKVNMNISVGSTLDVKEKDFSPIQTLSAGSSASSICEVNYVPPTPPKPTQPNAHDNV